jgi:hypothetical protein
VRLFTFLCQNKTKTFLTKKKKKKKKRKMCAVGKVCVILDFYFSGLKSRLPPFWTKDVGLGQIFLLDRVADLARTI